MSTITGSCNCGKHTVTISKTDFDAAMISTCHCVNCRKSAGSVVAVMVELPTKQVTFSSTDGSSPKEYQDRAGDSGRTLCRCFCDACGCPIRDYRAPDMQSFVRAGLFPPGTIARPVEELFVKHCEEWETKVDGAKSWKEMPEEE